VSDQWETEFGVVTLTTRELLALDDNERNFLLAASFIVNDIRFHWALLARSPTDGGGTNLGSMQLIRRFWGLRKLSSVIYEAINTIGAFCDEIENVRDIQTTKFSILGQEICRAQNSYNLAREFRNFSTFHYSKNQLAKGLKGFEDGALHRIFAHPQQGNSISELAEQIFTLPKLQKHDECEIKKFDDWCNDYSGAILKFCDTATAEIIMKAFPEKSYTMQAIDVTAEAAYPENR
jgi:hypothetical protein